MEERKDLRNLPDHDLLIILYTRQEELIKQFTNHLKHHFAVMITMLSVALTALVSLILTLMHRG